MKDAPMNGFVVESGQYGSKMTLSGPWTEGAAAFVRTNEIAELHLNYALGWDASSLAFVADIPYLKAIQVLAPSLQDLQPLEALRGLREMKLEVAKQAQLRLDLFPVLEEFSGFWVNVGESVFRVRQLSRLRLIGYTPSAPDGFQHLRRLRALALYSPGMRSLGSIALAVGLEALTIGHAQHLAGLDGIEALAGLRELVLENCKGVRSLAPIADLPRLRVLVVEAGGRIASLRPLHNLLDLEVVRFGGSTSVEDGDLTVLQALPKLKNLGFVQRKHYSLSWRSLPRQLFESRYELAWS